ncbi:unnamed protein product, partial [Cyprideis torosa]
PLPESVEAAEAAGWHWSLGTGPVRCRRESCWRRLVDGRLADPTALPPALGRTEDEAEGRNLNYVASAPQQNPSSTAVNIGDECRSIFQCSSINGAVCRGNPRTCTCPDDSTFDEASKSCKCAPPFELLLFSCRCPLGQRPQGDSCTQLFG